MLENTEGTIINGQSRETGTIGYKTKKNKTKTQHNNVRHHYTQTNINNINKTWALLQTTGGKDEPKIVFMQKS